MISMKTKKALLTCMLLAVSTHAFCNAFYVGVGAGPKAADFNKDSVTERPGAFNAHDNAHRSGTGLFGSLFGGYGWLHQAFYLAGEATLDGSSVKFQSSNNETIHNVYASIKYRMPYSLDLTVLPGYLYQSTLFYARLGYGLGYFKISSSDISLPSTNQYLNGVCFGLGINQKLTQQVAVRVEYRQVNYQNMTTHSYDPVGDVTNTIDVAPTTGQVEFAVVYDIA